MLRNLSILFFIVFSFQVSAQKITETNTDSLYFKALDLYRQSNFQASLEYSTKGLELAPEYHDIRILRTRNYWALEFYNEAGEDITYLLNSAPDYPGVAKLANRHILLIEQPEKALDFISILEKNRNASLKIRVLKASLLLKNKDKKAARELALQLFSEEDLNSDQRYTIQNILKRTISNEVGVNYQYIDFSKDYNRSDAWQTFSGDYLHYFGQSAVIGRISLVDRGYDGATLYEIEAYPVLSDKVYTFLNLGFSEGSIFPKIRTSASIFLNFLKSFELEAGGRLLHFSQQDYFTGIGGITYYVGKFYLNTRAFIGPERLNKLVQNYQLNIRYYLKDADNYLFARIGNGISPDERTIFTQVQENPGLEAYFLNLGINKTLGSKHLIQLTAGYLNEDLSNGSSGTQLIGNVGYRFRF